MPLAELALQPVGAFTVDEFRCIDWAMRTRASGLTVTRVARIDRRKGESATLTLVEHLESLVQIARLRRILT